MCRISSADCFISGFTASQSTQLRLRSIVGYTLLNGCLFCFAFASKVFLYIIRRNVRLKNIFNLCLTSFLCLLYFVLLSVFVLTSPQKDNYLSLLILESFNLFEGVFRKSFLPPHYNWKVLSRSLGYFTKILQKFFRYNWFFADGNISVFSKNLKHAAYILDICISFGGVFSEK